MRSLLLFALSFLTPSSFAAVTIVGVTNASNSVIDAGLAPIIYGGISGLDTDGECASKTGSSTCNSCTTSLAICNQQRIYDSLILEIVFRATGGTAGNVIATKEDRTTALTIQAGSSTNVGPNQDAVIRLLWSEVCSVVGEVAGGCSTGFTKPMFIGIDSSANGTLDGSEESLSVSMRVIAADVANATIDHCEQNPAPTQGICSFSTYPGDAKAYVEDLGNATGFPNGPGVKFTHLRFFYSETNFASVTPDLGTYTDIEIEEDTSGFQLIDNRIDNLENDVQYFFRVATIDTARNISNITSDVAIINYCGSLTPAAGDICPFRVTPNEVFGLLTEDLNCFVSTAAFGSSWNSKVEDFRVFRNQILSRSKFGQSLIRSYYNWGPKLARSIAPSPTYRLMARTALYPFWLSTKLILNFGWLGFSLIGLSFFAIFIIALRILRQQLRRLSAI